MYLCDKENYLWFHPRRKVWVPSHVTDYILCSLLWVLPNDRFFKIISVPFFSPFDTPQMFWNAVELRNIRHFVYLQRDWMKNKSVFKLQEIFLGLQNMSYHWPPERSSILLFVLPMTPLSLCVICSSIDLFKLFNC